MFLRVPFKGSNIKTNCYELNIAPPDNPFPTGGFVQREKATGAEPKYDGWNTFRRAGRGRPLRHQAQRQAGARLHRSDPGLRGLIGLQLNSGLAEFRNIKLKPLGLKSIFNGKDLTGWKSPEGNKSVLSVTAEGDLHLKGGKGALESDGQYGDFILQLQAMNTKNSNSGVFFRSINTRAVECFRFRPVPRLPTSCRNWSSIIAVRCCVRRRRLHATAGHYYRARHSSRLRRHGCAARSTARGRGHVARLVTGCPHDCVEDAMGVMTERRIRHLPILDDGKLMGLVSIGDLVKTQHDRLTMENHYLKSYIQG